jgi:hypothetical protein
MPAGPNKASPLPLARFFGPAIIAPAASGRSPLFPCTTKGRRLQVWVINCREMMSAETAAFSDSRQGCQPPQEHAHASGLRARCRALPRSRGRRAIVSVPCPAGARRSCRAPARRSPRARTGRRTTARHHAVAVEHRAVPTNGGAARSAGKGDRTNHAASAISSSCPLFDVPQAVGTCCDALRPDAFSGWPGRPPRPPIPARRGARPARHGVRGN